MELFGNNLISSLPGFGFDSKLDTLDLSYNSLNVLDLSNCNLSGTIPSSVWNLSELAYLNLKENQYLNDQLPPILGNLTRHSLNSTSRMPNLEVKPHTT